MLERSWTTDSRLAIVLIALLVGSMSRVDHAQESVPDIIKVLDSASASADEKMAASRRLRGLGTAAAPAVPVLTRLLDSPNERLRDSAVSTLGRLGAVAAPALPAMRRMAAADPSPQLRSVAATYVAALSGTGTAPPAVAAARTPAPATPPAVAAQSTSPRAGSQGAPPAGRPVLNEMRNRDFRWLEPEGWRAVSTDKGLTLEAPDGITQVSTAVLPKMMGTASPQQFLGMALGQLGYRNVQVTGVIDLPPLPSGYGAAQWRIQEFAASYVANGRSARGSWLVGTVGGLGTFDALMAGYQSPVESFDEAALWLAHIARSIVRTSELKSDYPLPKPRPLDNSGLIESWRRKGLSEDRISQARREGTMGYERMYDSKAGRHFDMPLERWDGTVGGYRSPLDSTRLLVKPRPDF